MGIYKICHSYACDDSGSVYLESPMDVSSTADIIIGLQLYIEDNTKYGEHSFITEEMAQYLMCNFFHCRPVERNKIRECREYSEEDGDIPWTNHIDLYADREERCGKGYGKYLKPIVLRKDTDFIKKLCAFYNDDAVFDHEPVHLLSVEEILEKY